MKHTILLLTFYLSLTISHAQTTDGAAPVADSSGSDQKADMFKKKTISISPATLYFTAERGESQNNRERPLLG